jgi:hypothetical protein
MVKADWVVVVSMVTRVMEPEPRVKAAAVNKAGPSSKIRVFWPRVSGAPGGGVKRSVRAVKAKVAMVLVLKLKYTGSGRFKTRRLESAGTFMSQAPS